MDYMKELVQRFPVRKSKEQKQAFRAWALNEMTAMGYKAKVEVNGALKHNNIVAGDPDHAAFLFTAHYDTPARMLLPNLMIPRNFPLFVLYQVLNILIIMVPALAAFVLVQGFTAMPRLALLAFIVVYFGLLLLLTRGPANPNNVNDNTSGVAAVLSLMAALPEEVRSKVAFILWDDEEKGKQGSKAYAKEHLQTAYTRLMVNMDCVGVGGHIVCGATRQARKCTGFGRLERALTETPGLEAHVFDSKTCLVNSDQASFKCGVSLSACKQARLVGFYTPAIHTSRDTVYDEKNIAWLTEALRSCVCAAAGQKEMEAE